jgi:hypothetical protein
MRIANTWTHLHDEIDALYKVHKNGCKVAELLIEKHQLGFDRKDALRIYINRRFAGKNKEQGMVINTKDQAVVDIKGKIKDLFKKQDVHTLESLSDHFDTGIGKIKTTVEGLINEGHNFKIENGYVLFSNIIEKSESRILNVNKMSSGFYRFGAVGDNHLCSRYERLDVLNALYDLYKSEGIEVVYNTGNWIDGEARFNKHDLKVHGLDNQLNYFIDNYPQKEGIVTHYITGDDHEGWYTQREGINVGMYTETKARKAGREDLVFLGHMEADVILKAKEGETKLRVLHPGGGSAYAISYTSQKIVESYTGGDKPHILLDGHYHKAGYNYIRGVHVVQTGCTQDQTPFMRKKRLAAHLGGWIIEFSVDDHGAITRFKQEFIPFYDSNYYKDGWEYKWR